MTRIKSFQVGKLNRMRDKNKGRLLGGREEPVATTCPEGH